MHVLIEGFQDTCFTHVFGRAWKQECPHTLLECNVAMKPGHSVAMLKAAEQTGQSKAKGNDSCECRPCLSTQALPQMYKVNKNVYLSRN